MVPPVVVVPVPVVVVPPVGVVVVVPAAATLNVIVPGAERTPLLSATVYWSVSVPV